jgi:CBS domain-containing protein
MANPLAERLDSLALHETVTVDAGDTLRSVAHTLWVAGIGAVVVTRGTAGMVGVISERDVVARVAQGDDLDALVAEDVMNRTVVALDEGDRLGDAAYAMLQGGFRHLPVVDADRRLVGMVSLRDLLRPALLDGRPDGGS